MTDEPENPYKSPAAAPPKPPAPLTPEEMDRREFLQNLVIGGGAGATIVPTALVSSDYAKAKSRGEKFSPTPKYIGRIALDALGGGAMGWLFATVGRKRSYYPTVRGMS